MGRVNQMHIFYEVENFEQMNKTSRGYFEESLVSRIAWLYFIKGCTQREISERINISRMQVQRSISKSKKEGLVQIQIKDPCTRYFEIEDDLKTRFSLSEAIVTPTPQNKTETNEAIAKAAADYLLRHVSDNQIIGVGWGTTLQNMTRFVKGKTLTNSRIVSLIGGWTKMTKESPHEIAYNLADALKTPCYYISAPAIADSLKSRSVITAEKSVHQILEIAKASDIAVLGIGNANTDSSLVKSGYLSADEIKQLRTSGAVGDICAQFYDAEGHPLDHEYMDRVIGLNLQDLKKIRIVIGIAAGSGKTAAICGALKGDLLDVLITDEQTAKVVLDVRTGDSK